MRSILQVMQFLRYTLAQNHELLFLLARERVTVRNENVQVVTMTIN